MSSFTLRIKCENAAFRDDDFDKAHEVARILREIASDLVNGQDRGPALDANGNTVGRWGFGR